MEIMGFWTGRVVPCPVAVSKMPDSRCPSKVVLQMHFDSGPGPNLESDFGHESGHQNPSRAGPIAWARTSPCCLHIFVVAVASAASEHTRTTLVVVLG